MKYALIWRNDSGNYMLGSKDGKVLTVTDGDPIKLPFKVIVTDHVNSVPVDFELDGTE